MKRALKLLLVVCFFVAAVTPLGAMAQSGQRFTIVNLVELAQAITGQIQLTPEKEAEYNLTGSGKLSISDLTMMAQEIMAPPKPPDTTQLIGENRAREIALGQVPGATDANIRQCRLDWDDGVQVYDVEIFFDRTEYDFDIHATTGEILSSSMEKPITPGQTGDIGEQRARQIVLERIPGATDANFTEFKKDRENGTAVYEGEVRYNGFEYDFELVAATGEVVKWTTDKYSQPGPAPTSTATARPTATAAPSTAPQLIGEQRAKEIALGEVIGATESNVHKCKLDREDGIQIYEVEIYFGGSKYEYDIHATTGEILSSHMDRPVRPGQTGDIGAQRAKQIVLDLIPGATEADFTQFKKDYDDGVAIYEGEVRYNGIEYDFEIVAATGELVEWTTDRYTQPVPMPTGSVRPTATPGPDFIGEQRAKEIALAEVIGATESNVHRCKLDWEDGVRVYEVEIYFGGAEYDYDIHATTGEILSSNMERPVRPGQTGDIGEQRARQIVLGMIPGATDANFTEFKRDREDGTIIYEGEVRYQGIEYDFEIVAATGEVVKWTTDRYMQPGPAPSTTPTPSAQPTATVRPTPAPTVQPSAPGIITAEEAQRIALARVPGATAANIYKCELDWDDGMQIYEIEIRVGRWEYDIEINARTGAIIDYDEDYDD